MNHHSPLIKIAYPFIRAWFWLLFLFFFAPMRRRSQKLVPQSGPLLILANHISNTDPVLVQYSCPRLIHFMARRDLFNWTFIGSLLRHWRAFPVTQSAADTEAIRRAIDLIGEGHAVCIFPEGQLSPDGNLIDILPGAHLIVRRTEVTCICVGLQGTNRLMPHPRVTPKFAFTWLTATWGTPRKFTKADSREEFLSWVESELRTLSNQQKPLP